MSLNNLEKAILNILLPIIPKEADIFYGYIFIYSGYQASEYSYLVGNTILNFNDFPNKEYKEICNKLINFTSISNIKSNHFLIKISKKDNINLQFSFVPREDSWPGLYMKGISELTWTEADAYRIPYDIWKKKSKQYISEQDRFYQELLSVFERNIERVGWTVLFRGCIYQEQPQYEAFAIDADGTLHPQALELKKSQHLRLPKLLRQMQKSKLYPQPWTHFECRLGFMIPFEFHVANIPETDYWQGLYMRGISELTWQEAEQVGIPKEVWQHHQAA